jgi:hypothetical protein
LTVEGLAEVLNPAALITNFAAYLDKSKVSDRWKGDSRPAAAVLVDLLLPGAKLADNAFWRSFSRSIAVTIWRQSRYRDVWNMGPVLDGIRNAAPVERLNWKGKKTRGPFVLTVFGPPRMVAVWRLDPPTQKPRKVEGVIEVEMRDKTRIARNRWR